MKHINSVISNIIASNLVSKAISSCFFFFHISLKNTIFAVSYNPNVPAGLVGKVQKKLSLEGGRKEGRVEKKARAVCPLGPGLEPGTCRVLGEDPQLHAMGAV